MVTQSTSGGGSGAPRDDRNVRRHGAGENEDPRLQAGAAEHEKEAAHDRQDPETQEAGDPLAVLRDEADQLREEVAELKDQLLRALAETENLRNRARREREEAVRYAAAPLAKDLLPVADNLRRAIDSVPAEAAEENEKLKGLLVGVEMTEKSLIDSLAKHGIVQIDPLGERLDPHRHEAMMEMPDPDRPAGTIVQVFEIGYLLHERLLRPARVGVATGGPSSPPGRQEQGD